MLYRVIATPVDPNDPARYEVGRGRLLKPGAGSDYDSPSAATQAIVSLERKLERDGKKGQFTFEFKPVRALT